MQTWSHAIAPGSVGQHVPDGLCPGPARGPRGTGASKPGHFIANAELWPTWKVNPHTHLLTSPPHPAPQQLLERISVSAPSWAGADSQVSSFTQFVPFPAFPLRRHWLAGGVEQSRKHLWALPGQRVCSWGRCPRGQCPAGGEGSWGAGVPDCAAGGELLHPSWCLGEGPTECQARRPGVASMFKVFYLNRFFC